MPSLTAYLELFPDLQSGRFIQKFEATYQERTVIELAVSTHGLCIYFLHFRTVCMLVCFIPACCPLKGISANQRLVWFAMVFSLLKAHYLHCDCLNAS